MKFRRRLAFVDQSPEVADPRPNDEKIYLFAKRAIDLLIAVPALFLTSPLILLFMVAVKLVDPGPAIFAQKRVCQKGKLCKMYKIRSMYVDAEQRLERLLREDDSARAEWDRYVKLNEDPRVLPIIGQLVRSTSIDELPQLWNVIRGDISLVGPRPFPPYHLEKFDAQFRAIRQSVPQGLTGYWQVNSRSSGDIEMQIKEDLFYIQNRSLLFDIYILLKTVPAVFARKGAQ